MILKYFILHKCRTAAGCTATAHCIKTMWKDMKVPEDNDTVCNICKDMVQQAHDQLESNQTQEDLKAVFEGSCRLIHVTPIVKECITIVDQFIPELVETLASQMNPSLVCSVAGLCNSAHMDKLLMEYEQSEPKVINNLNYFFTIIYIKIYILKYSFLFYMQIFVFNILYSRPQK